MRSPTYLFASVLGLLVGLSVALQPIFSTVSDPFSLTAADIQRFNVTLEFNATLNAFVPLLSLTPQTQVYSYSRTETSRLQTARKQPFSATLLRSFHHLCYLCSSARVVE